MKKSTIFTWILIIFCAAVFGLGLRGLPGNPTAEELNTVAWKEQGPLELSPDRGRYALAYSVIENKSLQFSLPIARFTTPDLAVSASGKYVSLFAPGVSFLILPGYILGKYFGLAQVGSFAVIALFAILNILLIRAIATRLGAHPIAATIGALTFAFATPAFTYAVTLYQHHISVFLILLSIYSLLRWKGLWPVALVWFLLALSVVVDNPNIFFMLPIALFATGRIISVHREGRAFVFSFKLFGLLTFLTAALPIAFFLWFNQASYGNPIQLPGTLPSVQALDEQGNPVKPAALEALQGGKNSESEQSQKSAIGFFKTRNLLNGFYIHFISPDRGIVNYAPIVLFGIYGLFLLYRRNAAMANLFIAIGGMNVLLYSMWGDPWGGWAFGSRYLIPTFAILAIGIALTLSQWRKNYLFLFVFLVVFGYSVWVNTLGAITSSTNPPQVEVLALEKFSGIEEKYTFERNTQYLDKNKSKSFVFQEYASRSMSAWQYHWLLSMMIVGTVLLMLVWFVLARTRESLYEK